MIVRAIQFFCQHGHWLLLEDVAEGLARWLLYPPHASEERARVERISVTVRKPGALGNAGRAAVTYTADATSEPGTGAGICILVETSCVVARRVLLETGRVWTKHRRHCFFVLSGALDRSGASIARGSVLGRTIDSHEYKALQHSVLLEVER